MANARIGTILGTIALLICLGASAGGAATARGMTCEDARANLNRAQAELQYAHTHLNQEGIGRAEAALTGAKIAKESACR